MSLKKKIIIAVIAVVVLLGLGSFMKIQSDRDSGAKAIEITVVDKTKTKTIYQETLHTDAETLKAFLSEKEELKVVVEDGAYGAYITSILDLAADSSKGPWWVYESSNNADCLAQGMCPAIDQVNLKDKDEFTFTYTSEITY